MTTAPVDESLASTPDAGDFDLGAYLKGRGVRRRGLDSPAYRRAITRNDPLLFALLYLPHHLRGEDTGDQITLSQFHMDIVEHARRWIVPTTRPAEERDVWVAPRGCGKSTWWFLIIPMWAAAHGHRSFIAAFADTATQAETHLLTFKRELQLNKALRVDFPDLCAPARRPTGFAVADNVSMYLAASGFVFTAKGIDSTSLGLKIDNRRPDLLLCDDIEPGEEMYSADQKTKRLGALLDSILPLSIYARVVVVGTVTMAGSIIHDAVRTITQPGEKPADWVVDEGFRVHYYPALIVDEETGDERSLWPGKWSLAYLQSIRHTRSFKKNYQNDPLGADGDYWTEDDFRYGTTVITHQLLSVDPAVTDKTRSDFTGLAVIGFNKSTGTAVVRYARAVKVPPGEQLRAVVLRLLAQYPETSGVLVETNQGGDTWKTVLHDLPVKLRLVHQTAPKDVRAAQLLNRYQRGRVLHEQRLPDAEGQMVAYPKAPHDDIVDAIGTGVAAFLDVKKTTRSTQSSYAA